MRPPALSLLLTTLWLAPPVLAQAAPPVAPTFSVSVRADGTLERKLSERELLRTLLDYLKADPNRQRRVIDAVSFAAHQRQRVGLVTAVVRQAFGRIALLQPDIDRYLAILRVRYPEIDFKDPDVLSVLKGNASGLSRTIGGLMVEPSAVALFALLDPELATRGRLIALEEQLARRGTWDPEGNTRLQLQIEALRRALGDGVRDPIAEPERLIALQKLLREQGVPIPSSSEGVEILISGILGRAAEIVEGRNLPMAVDLIRLDPSGLVQRAFQKLEDRIVATEGQPPTP